MKFRKILAVTLCVSFAFALPVQAQNPFSTAGLQAWKQSITAAGRMGAPRFTTAAAPTCDANNVSALLWDTTLVGLYVCNGSAYVAAGGTGIALNTAQTPDAMVLSTNALSNSFLIIETADAAFDFAHAQATNPTLFIHSATQNTTQWISLTHDATNAVISTGAGALNLNGASGNSAISLPAAGGMTLNALNAGIFTINTGTGSPFPRLYMGNTAKALTAAAATAFVQIGVPAGSHTGIVIDYTIVADDGTDFQSRAGMLVVSAINKAGTETCTVSTVGAATEVVAVSAGTLTNTFTCSTSPTNGINVEANAASSLTETTLSINYQVRKNGGLGGITAQ